MGLVDFNYMQTVADAKGLVSPNQLDCAEKMGKFLKEQGCDVIIALTHMLNHSDDLL